MANMLKQYISLTLIISCYGEEKTGQAQAKARDKIEGKERETLVVNGLSLWSDSPPAPYPSRQRESEAERGW